MNGIDWAGIRAEHPIAEAIRRAGIDLPAASGDVAICCPMPGHDDTTPSMVVHLDTDRYHCFGCGARGDVIQWTRDLYGVSAVGAIRVLDGHDRPIATTNTRPAFDPPARPSAQVRSRAERPDLDRTPPERVWAALVATWRYYTYSALHQRGAAYLAGRRIDITALEAETGEPVVGHTPARADGLLTYLTKHDFSLDELVDAGLASRHPAGRRIDFFRHRAILPVRDGQGRLAGLLGRSTTAAGGPKYLNMARTHTYDKSKALYRPTVSILDRHANVVVCEGSLDALAIAAQAATSRISYRYAPVAPSGVALSAPQLEEILSIHPLPLVISGDGDPAGRRATVEWATRAALAGRETVVTLWPDGHDPASWIAQHGENGLLAVTRKGCLQQSATHLRPRHAGELIAQVAIDEIRMRDLPPTAVLGLVRRPLEHLSGAAAVRYAAAARSVLPYFPYDEVRREPLVALPTDTVTDSTTLTVES